MTQTEQTTVAPPSAATETTADQAANQAASAAEARPPEAQGVDVHQVELPQAEAAVHRTAGGQIDLLLDTTLSVSVCLGEAEIQVRDLLQMGPGSVLKLDRQVGQPLDLFVRGVRFATGQLVVVGDRLAIRIKEILPPASAEGAATN